MNQTCLTILLKDPHSENPCLQMRELGAIVRTGSGFCCTQNAGFPDIPRPQHDNVFCRGISPLFNDDPLVDSYGFCTTAIAVGLFFGCSGDHRTSERLAWASKKCGGDRGDLSVRNGGCTRPGLVFDIRRWDSSVPYEATEYGDHRSPQADRISHDLSNYTVYLTVVGFLVRSTIPKSSTPQCIRTKSNGS